MSGGIHAIEGFDYQAMVILELSLKHFQHDAGGRVRPEGSDDADLESADGRHVEHVQVKKPRRTDIGALKHEPWNLTDVAATLLPGAFTRLRGTHAQQKWVLGDTVEPEVSALVAAGEAAATTATEHFLRSVHLVALEKMGASPDVRRTIGRWTPLPDLEAMAVHVEKRIATAGLDPAVAVGYRDAARTIDAELPGVLSRITILENYGLEDDVRDRVCALLVAHHGLALEVARDSISRNLRGFINDVAKRRRGFDREELELELRAVWPHLVAVRDPPPPPREHVPRPAVVELIQRAMTGPATEIIALSGAGKTTAAGELIAVLRNRGRLTLYAPVRTDATFRDLLTGIGFVLRRYALTEIFTLATQSNTDEALIRKIADAFVASALSITVVIDAIDGDVSEGFARDLAILVSALAGSTNLHLIAFGKSSVLRGIPGADRAWLRVTTIALPGFSFEEFVLLAARSGTADRAALHSVYEHVTAGRTGGLLPSTAATLSRLSIPDMVRVASLPPDQTLLDAEHTRFNAVPTALRVAAERVVCSILPFRPADLSALFPSEPIPAAIAELERRGLLERHDSTHVEMHESVRRPLETLVRPSVAAETHRALANFHAAAGDLGAQLLHLDIAGDREEANHIARAAFLAGTRRPQLARLVAARGLVSAAEVVAWFAGNEFENWYLLPDILVGIGITTTGEQLLQLLARDPSRLDRDFSWGFRLFEAVLVCDPSCLDRLVNVAIADRSGTRLAQLEFATSARRIDVSDDVLVRFRSSESPTKKALLQLLLSDSRVDVLNEALAFVVDNGPDGPPAAPERRLRMTTRADAERLLAALPDAEIPRIVVNRSPCLGRVTELLWPHRDILIPICREVIGSAGAPAQSVKAAIRVLLFFGDVGIIEPLRLVARGSEAYSLAVVVASFFGNREPLVELEATVTDTNRPLNDRVEALGLAGLLGSDLGALWRTVKSSASPEDVPKLGFMFALQSALHPFPEAAELVEVELGREGSAYLGALLVRLAHVGGDEVTDVFIRCLRHAVLEVRVAASQALGMRRRPQALEPLIDAALNEADPQVRLQHAVSALACHPTTATPFQTLAAKTPEAMWTAAVAIGRLRSHDDASTLVSLATNPFARWKVRRAAINSAARLPPHLALDAIGPPILAETSGLEDDHLELWSHAVLIEVLTAGSARVVQAAASSSEDAFIRRFQSWFGTNSVMGEKCLAWVWKHVPRSVGDVEQTAEALLDRLHVPALHAAVLRGYRLAGEAARLEEALQGAKSRWFAMRALVERCRASRVSPDDRKRLSEIVEARPPDERLQLGRALPNEAVPVAPQALKEPTPSVLEVEIGVVEALDALRVGTLSPDVTAVSMDSSESQKVIELVAELAPSRDRRPVLHRPSKPDVVVKSDSFSLGQRSFKYVDNNEALRRRLRQLVIVSAREDIAIPWHAEALQDPEHVKALVRHLASRGKSDLLVRVVQRDPTLLLRISKWETAAPLIPLVDARMIPWLARFAQSGSDELFNVFCSMARRIDSKEVEPLLGLLLARWLHELEVRQRDDDGSDTDLWKGFARLSENPRLLAVPEAIELLQRATLLPMPWYKLQDVVSVLAGAPRAYARLEALLLKTAVFPTYRRDMVDILDDACEASFNVHG